MLSRLLVACLALAIVGERDARAAPQTTTTTPYPGVTHTVFSDDTLPLKLHLVTVDVSSQEIHLYATQAAERGQTVSEFANCKKGASGCVPTEVAINGDLFQPLGYVPSGLAMGGAKLWPDANMDNGTEGYLAFGRPNDVNALYLSMPSAVELPPKSIAAEGVVGGRALLVSGGQAQASFDAADPTEPFRSAPRTAVGVDVDRHTLFLVVVEGDQAASAGMTAGELADFLAAHGTADAIELDGGGSSEMYIKNQGGVVSSPSDGVERPVANQLGVHYGMSTVRCSVVGKVFDSQFNGPNVITNAVVEVDGVTANWNTVAPAHTVYNVDNVGPHFTCSHASAPKYMSATTCRQITTADIQMSQLQYLSLVLFPCPNGATSCDPPPDMATPPDMAGPRQRPDLGVAHDLASSVPDAGDGTVVGRSGCAMVGSAPRGAFPLFILVVFLGAAILRARTRFGTRKGPA